MFFRKKKDPEKTCRFCSNAKIIADSDNVLCNLLGVVCSDYTCKKFKYDFLKRDPGRTARIDALEFVDLND